LTWNHGFSHVVFVAVQFRYCFEQISILFVLQSAVFGYVWPGQNIDDLQSTSNSFVVRKSPEWCVKKSVR